MRNIFLIILCFWGRSAFCQKYHFDRIVEYKITNQDSERKTTMFFFNSKDTSYFFLNTSDYKKIEAYLIDKKKNIMHRYNVEDLSISDDYKYLYSKSSLSNCIPSECSTMHVKETKLKNDTNSEIAVTQFKDQRKKRKVYTIKIQTKPCDIPILNSIISNSSEYCICKELDINKFNIPTSIISKSGRKRLKQELVLEKNLDIDFQVDEQNIRYQQ